MTPSFASGDDFDPLNHLPPTDYAPAPGDSDDGDEVIVKYNNGYTVSWKWVGGVMVNEIVLGVPIDPIVDVLNADGSITYSTNYYYPNQAPVPQSWTTGAPFAAVNQPWSDDGTQETTATAVDFTDRISQDNGVTVNSATAAHPNTLYVADGNGGANGGGTVRTDGPIAVRNNAVTTGTNYDYDTLVANSGNANGLNVIRHTTGAQRWYITAGNFLSGTNVNGGAHIGLFANQLTSLQNALGGAGSAYMSTGAVNATGGTKEPILILANTHPIAITTNTSGNNGGQGAADTTASLKIDEGVVNIHEKPFDGASANLFDDFSALFTYGGRLFAQSAPNVDGNPLSPSSNIVVQLTSHSPEVVGALQKVGMVSSEVNPRLVHVQTSFCIFEACMSLNILGSYYEIQIATGEVKKVSPEGKVETSKIEVPEFYKKAVYIEGVELSATASERWEVKEKQKLKLNSKHEIIASPFDN